MVAPSKPHTTVTDFDVRYAVSCCVAVVHSTIVASWAIVLLSSHPTLDLSAPLSDFPKEWQQTAFQMTTCCTAYMIQDLTSTLYKGPENQKMGYITVLLHHVASLTKMGTCMYFRAGFVSLAVLCAFGEGMVYNSDLLSLPLR